MSNEMSRWTALSVEQGDFWAGQLAAAKQTAFSQTALRAGIAPLDIKVSSGRVHYLAQDVQLALWRNPYDPADACALMGTNGNENASAFVNLTPVSNGFEAEGVAVSIGYDLYGTQFLPSIPGESDIMQAQIAIIEFLARALDKSLDLEERFRANPPTELVGVDDRATARLFTFLGSLTNLASANERKTSSNEPVYELAKSLLEFAVQRADARNPKNGILIGNDKCGVIGAMFEDNYGINFVRQTPILDTIALATVSHPDFYYNVQTVEQYHINPNEATLDMMLWTPGTLTAEEMLHELSFFDHPIARNNAVKSPENRTLEMRLLDLIANRRRKA